jgi:hypothetical protein
MNVKQNLWNIVKLYWQRIGKVHAYIMVFKAIMLEVHNAIFIARSCDEGPLG